MPALAPTFTLALALSALPPGRETPAARALTTADALFEIRGARVLAGGDLDGDKQPDLVVQVSHYAEQRLVAVSAKDGRSIREVWAGISLRRHELSWDSGVDVDRDGFGDVLVGDPGSAGSAQLISGQTGQALQVIAGQPGDWLGWSVALVGDVNSDGFCDYALGAIEANPRLDMDPGAHSDEADLAFRYQALLAKRSAKPGYVSMRSGRDAKEIWRVSGSRAGHAFGARVVAFGDVNRDGCPDVLVQCERQSAEPVKVLSGSDGTELRRVQGRYGPAGAAGDIDGDGVADIFLDSQSIDSTARLSGVVVVSGSTSREIAQLAYPDICGDYGMTASVGDLDGDGYGDLAVGEPNYNIPGPGDPGFAGVPIDISSFTLEEALRMKSEPCTIMHESGCVLVYSGATGNVICGVWGLPGSQQGIGYSITPIPDITGDGALDIVVSGAESAFVFAGSGKAE